MSSAAGVFLEFDGVADPSSGVPAFVAVVPLSLFRNQSICRIIFALLVRFLLFSKIDLKL